MSYDSDYHERTANCTIEELGRELCGHIARAKIQDKYRRANRLGIAAFAASIVFPIASLLYGNHAISLATQTPIALASIRARKQKEECERMSLELEERLNESFKNV